MPNIAFFSIQFCSALTTVRPGKPPKTQEGKSHSTAQATRDFGDTGNYFQALLQH